MGSLPFPTFLFNSITQSSSCLTSLVSLPLTPTAFFVYLIFPTLHSRANSSFARRRVNFSILYFRAAFSAQGAQTSSRIIARTAFSAAQLACNSAFSFCILCISLTTRRTSHFFPKLARFEFLNRPFFHGSLDRQSLLSVSHPQTKNLFPN